MARSYGAALLPDRDRGMCPLCFIFFFCGLPCRLPLPWTWVHFLVPAPLGRFIVYFWGGEPTGLKGRFRVRSEHCGLVVSSPEYYVCLDTQTLCRFGKRLDRYLDLERAPPSLNRPHRSTLSTSTSLTLDLPLYDVSPFAMLMLML